MSILVCPACHGQLSGPCGDSAWSERWVFMCFNNNCEWDIEVSIPDAEYALLTSKDT